MRGRGLPTAVVLAATSFALDFGFIPQALAETSDLSLTAQSVQNSQAKAPTLAFNISPQPLESGLVAFSKQADINIIGVTAILRDHRVAVLKGDFTKAEALDRLLEGTGLSYEMINDTAVSIFVKS